MLSTYDADAIAEVMGLEMPATAGDRPPSKEMDWPLPSMSAPPGSGFGESRYVLREEAVPFDHGQIGLSAAAIESAVENGLPRTALRHVAGWLAGNDVNRIPAFEWMVVPKTTLDRRTVKLSVPEGERTERIARLAVQARRALGTDGEARVFMTSPHPELDGRSPVEASRTDLGGRRTERILLALEYGLAL